MVIVLELNKEDGINVKEKKVWIERDCFPIKVTLYNNKNKLKNSERLIFIREKKGIPIMVLS